MYVRTVSMNVCVSTGRLTLEATRDDRIPLLGVVSIRSDRKASTDASRRTDTDSRLFEAESQFLEGSICALR